MTELVRFIDGVDYTEQDQADFQHRMMRPQGVIPESALGTLTLSAIGGMNVRVGTGEAFIQGFQYLNDANKTLVVAANSSGSTRIDRVIIKLDRTANTLTAQIKQGTPGAGAPSLTQIGGGTWEFPLYAVTVAHAAASITGPDLTDERVYSRWPISALDQTLDTQAARIADVDAEESARIASDVALDGRLDVLEPLRAKALGSIASGGSLNFGTGIASSTRNSAGVYTVTISNAITNMYIFVTCSGASGSSRYAVASQVNTTQIQVITKDETSGTGVSTDTPFFISVYGS